ncbi:MAG: hypothetical protein ACPGWR_03100 [Ardenticatenaceae bacterium]
MAATVLSLTFRGPVLIYQRHRQAIENLLIAGALTLLVGLFLDATAIYPAQWRTVLLLTILMVGTQWRDWGYYIAFASLLWPLWNLSPYLMTLFVAVALLPRYWIIEYLPWVLLVVSAPLLTEWQIIALVPLLAGLVAGPATGWWTGVLSVLWVKLVAGMSGVLPELGALHGLFFSLAPIESHFTHASSLETLELLAAPFAESSFLLLLHLLQAAAWGLAGFLVGTIHEMEWRKGRPSFILLPTLALGFLVLWAGLYLLPAWLELQSFSVFLKDWMPTAGVALSVLAAGLLAMFYESMQRPVPPPDLPREGAPTVEPRVPSGASKPRREPFVESKRPSSRPVKLRPMQDGTIMLEFDD